MAQRLRQELETVPLPMNRKGMALVTPGTVSTFLHARNNLPAPDRPADDIPHAALSVRTGEVHLNDRLWLSEKETIPAAQVARDARMLVAYISSFAAFYGNSQSAMASYWAFLVWLYMAPFAAFLRQGAVINHIDPWLYPPYAVLYGRSSGARPCSRGSLPNPCSGSSKHPLIGLYRTARTGPAPRAGSHSIAD